ncbi:hypothetical protein AVEN_134970-1 [Araneus ventricosus]|uniref:Mos1 transposase HTH domain-containing protein n=1 Tax=Araneus ventricosus TaxID=182803 RepID=A0A4Y2CJ23_ARAVE|nr:hypothetical protein AVEN_134970-1 [Araneus ventricosus]
MSRQAIAKWGNMFETGHTDIDDVEREGRPSTVTNSEIAARVNESILANRRVAVEEIATKLDISHGSVHKITVKHLEFTTVGLSEKGKYNSEEWSIDEDGTPSPNSYTASAGGHLTSADLMCK